MFINGLLFADVIVTSDIHVCICQFITLKISKDSFKNRFLKIHGCEFWNEQFIPTRFDKVSQKQ